MFVRRRLRRGGRKPAGETPAGGASGSCWVPGVQSVMSWRQTPKRRFTLGKDASVGHINDFAQIASYGVMSTPALVVDGKVSHAARPQTEDIVKFLNTAGFKAGLLRPQPRCARC
jgi:hypothetical protein